MGREKNSPLGTDPPCQKKEIENLWAILTQGLGIDKTILM